MSPFDPARKRKGNVKHCLSHGPPHWHSPIRLGHSLEIVIPVYIRRSRSSLHDFFRPEFHCAGHFWRKLGDLVSQPQFRQDVCAIDNIWNNSWGTCLFPTRNLWIFPHQDRHHSVLQREQRTAMLRHDRNQMQITKIACCGGTHLQNAMTNCECRVFHLLQIADELHPSRSRKFL